MRNRIVMSSLRVIAALLAGCAFLSAQGAADRAAQLAEAGDLKQAEAVIREAVSTSPRDAQLQAQLGSILSLQGRFKEANTVLVRALELNPSDLVIRWNLAANQWILRDFEGAQKNLERVLKARPGDQQATLLLGMVSESRKDYARAVELLSSVAGAAKARPESAAALARSYYGVGMTAKGRQALEDLQRARPGPEGTFLAGQIALGGRDYGAAERLFQSIQRTYPDKARAAYNLAESEFRAGRYAECRKTLLAVIAGGRRSSEVFNLLAWCYEREQNMADAVAAMKEAAALAPKDESNYLDLATMLNARQVFKAALDAARRAAETAPHSVDACRLQAQIETKVYPGFTQAADTYKKAILRNPGSPDFLREFAVAQWQNRLPKEAAATFEAGLKRFPRDAKMKQDYARMLLTQAGDDAAAKTRAVALLNAALAIDDRLAEAHFELGRLALEEERFEEGLRHLEAAARLNPSASKIHYRLVAAYRNLGKEAAASKEAELAVRLKAQEDQDRVGPPRRI